MPGQLLHIQAGGAAYKREIEAGTVKSNDGTHPFQGPGNKNIGHLDTGELDHFLSRDVDANN